ncbi:hypothetical protein BS50DRAFT_94980 [Corynespora cassiicola Philippines]|uniref:Uncharacterized protein n=1 Tax=Corynespora cassiicola Philippines TaxID=1448308 RepID=A0A2T2NF46_CORCC|nr:hypothetical protein BS50DRAFT_94980 [Corynespora cassiicola Philippines]
MTPEASLLESCCCIRTCCASNTLRLLSLYSHRQSPSTPFQCPPIPCHAIPHPPIPPAGHPPQCVSILICSVTMLQLTSGNWELDMQGRRDTLACSLCRSVCRETVGRFLQPNPSQQSARLD